MSTFCKNHFLHIPRCAGGEWFLVLLTLAVSILIVAADTRTVRAQTPTEADITAAIADVGRLVGKTISSSEEAKALCDTERFITECAEIGKRHHLFNADEIKHVDSVLSELSGSTAEALKRCTTTACLVEVANDLAKRITEKDPSAARALDLTPKSVSQKKRLIEAAQEIGVEIEECKAMDPDTASTDLLRLCARLAKHERVQAVLSPEGRSGAEASEASVELQLALRRGDIECGDGTLEGCGNFCLNPGKEGRGEGVRGIPPVCRTIATRFFGNEGITELEAAYEDVATAVATQERHIEEASFTTVDGRTITTPVAIGRYIEGEAARGNVEAVEVGVNFLFTRGLVTQQERDFALKMVRKIRATGSTVDFAACEANPLSCETFIPDDERTTFTANTRVDEIIRAELKNRGITDPRGCESESAHEACIAATRTVLPRLEALAAETPAAEGAVEGIRRTIERASKTMAAREEAQRQIESGTVITIGDRSFRTFLEMETFCRQNGELCLAEAARRGIVDRDTARTKYEAVYEIKQTEKATEPPAPLPTTARRITDDGIETTETSFLPRKINKEEALRRFEAWLDNPEGPPPLPTNVRRVPGFVPPYVCPDISVAFPAPCQIGFYREFISRGPNRCPSFGTCIPIPDFDREPVRPICPLMNDFECPTGSSKRGFTGTSGCPVYECVFEQRAPNATGRAKFLFSGGADGADGAKYALELKDEDGIRTFTISKPGGASFVSGSGGCKTEVTSESVFLERSEFPLFATVNDCRGSSENFKIVKPEEPKTVICPALFSVVSCPAGETRVVSWSSPECGEYYACEADPTRTASTTPISTDPSCKEIESLIPGCHAMEQNPSVRFNTAMTKYVIVGSYAVKSCSSEYVTGCSGGSGQSGVCTDAQIALLGTGCHSMGNAYFNTRMTRYVLPGGTRVIDCSTSYITN
ncbi:MAG: hypothetical protein G01um101472_295, partial [Parcubacteria group bacterium Gr01-1014_72]